MPSRVMMDMGMTGTKSARTLGIGRSTPGFLGGIRSLPGMLMDMPVAMPDAKMMVSQTHLQIRCMRLKAFISGKGARSGVARRAGAQALQALLCSRMVDGALFQFLEQLVRGRGIIAQ